MFSEGTAEEGHKNTAWAKRRPKCHRLVIKRPNVANLLEACICWQVLQYAKCKKRQAYKGKDLKHIDKKIDKCYKRRTLFMLYL